MLSTAHWQPIDPASMPCARLHQPSLPHLHAAALGLRVAAVLGAAATLLVRRLNGQRHSGLGQEGQQAAAAGQSEGEPATASTQARGGGGRRPAGHHAAGRRMLPVICSALHCRWQGPASLQRAHLPHAGALLQLLARQEAAARQLAAGEGGGQHGVANWAGGRCSRGCSVQSAGFRLAGVLTSCGEGLPEQPGAMGARRCGMERAELEGWRHGRPRKRRQLFPARGMQSEAHIEGLWALQMARRRRLPAAARCRPCSPARGRAQALMAPWPPAHGPWHGCSVSAGLMLYGSNVEVETAP